MTLKRDHNTCTECEGEFHEDANITWRRNIDDGLVCGGCAKDLPEIGFVKLKDSGLFYGYANRRMKLGGWGSADTGYLKTKAEARTCIIEMCRKLWGDVTIIEEEEV